MRTKKYTGAVIVMMLAIISCKQEEYYLYNEIARIQFGPDPSRIYTASFNLADTLKLHTFFYDDASVSEDTVFFDIYAVGGVAKTDRSFTLQQEELPGVVNAVAGTHYVAFNDERASQHYVIKAGEVHTRVPVIVLRDPSLKDNTAVLKLKVIDNDNFKIGEANNLWRKVEITDRLSRPAAWDDSFTQYYFGKYSVTKHKLMIDVTGETWDQEFIKATMSDYPLLKYYTSVVKAAVIDYNANHPGNPLTDESGELVVIP